MQRTTYKIAKMDCLSEETIIGMKLEDGRNIIALKFEITERKLFVLHKGDVTSITAAIDSLHFNLSLIKTQKIDD